MKKTIRLINNERVKVCVVGAKGCTSTADICSIFDQAHCLSNAYDSCAKDYATCSSNAIDICEYIDQGACSGAGTVDRCTYTDMNGCSGGNYDYN